MQIAKRNTRSVCRFRQKIIRTRFILQKIADGLHRRMIISAAADKCQFFVTALKGDAEALEAYRQLSEHIAAAVKIVMLAVDPEMIVFGGSVAAAHALFEKSLWENLRDFAYPNSVKRLRIFFSEMENPAILGAASLCY